MYESLFTRTLIALLVLGVATDSYLLSMQKAIPAPAKQASPESAPEKTSLATPGTGTASLPNFSALLAQKGRSW